MSEHVRPFHLAFPVRDLKETRDFYVNILGCTTGRSSNNWIDFNLYGHQVVAHLVKQPAMENSYNRVDEHSIPVPHFGVILTMPEWQLLADRLKQQDIKFIVEPYIRFKGQPGEQATMFFLDPDGNALEFKAFNADDQIFAR